MVATHAGDGAVRSRPGAGPEAQGEPPAAATLPAPLLSDGRVTPFELDLTGAAGEAPRSDLETRILDAALACVARWGVAKTTLDDIAREAGCSRATVYRVVPGGKDALLLATANRELVWFFAHLTQILAAESTLEDLLTVGLSEASRLIAGHGALEYLVEHEPEVVLPFVSFDALDPLLEWSAAFGAAALGRFVSRADARAIGEWAARVVVSYAFDPTDHVDLSDTATARRFVRRYGISHLTPAGSPAHSPVARLRTEQEQP